MKRPWIPFWPGNYLADTQHLNCQQHGAYFLLILQYWQQGGLDDDDRQLAKVTRLSVPVWQKMRPTIQAFFHDGWLHKRIDADLASYQRKVGLLRIAGHKGGTQAAIAKAKSKHLLPPQSSIPASKNGSLAVGRKKKINTTFVGTARARGEPELVGGEGQRLGNAGASRTTTSELDRLMAAKGWVP